MTKKLYKQNDYPGERIAEKKRVSDRAIKAERKADARVAEKGRTETLKANARVARRDRMDSELLDSEIQRSTTRATKVRRSKNITDTIGLFTIVGLITILLAGSVWGYSLIQGQSKQIDNLTSQLDNTSSNTNQLSVTNSTISGESDAVMPTTAFMTPLSPVSPSNNEMDIETNVKISAMFNKDMNPETINKSTFIVRQRTTPEFGSYRSLILNGTITYSDHIATFTSNERFHPNQIYGNVFTATLTRGITDITGKPIANEYIWSFTTGESAFNEGITTTQTN